MAAPPLPSARTPKQRAGDEAEEAAARHLIGLGLPHRGAQCALSRRRSRFDRA